MNETHGSIPVTHNPRPSSQSPDPLMARADSVLELHIVNSNFMYGTFILDSWVLADAVASRRSFSMMLSELG